MKNVAYTQIGLIVICYYNAEAPTERDHKESIAFFRSLDFDSVRVLALTEGGSPSTVQRKEFNDALRGHEIPLAVVTDSRLVRGTLTAFGWFNRNIRAFSWTNIVDALSYLKVPDTQHDKFLNEVQGLQDQVRGKGTWPQRRARFSAMLGTDPPPAPISTVPSAPTSARTPPSTPPSNRGVSPEHASEPSPQADLLKMP